MLRKIAEPERAPVRQKSVLRAAESACEVVGRARGGPSPAAGSQRHYQRRGNFRPGSLSGYEVAYWGQKWRFPPDA